MMIENYRLVLSLNRALWGAVTPNMRAACIENKENRINIFFYYENPPTENEKELAEVASTEVISDFSGLMLDVKIKIVGNAFFQKEGSLVYQRYEEN